MLYIITPCSRPQNLPIIHQSIPKECHWIICHDNKIHAPPYANSTIMTCENTGLVGTLARNYVLDNFNFNDDDHILFHDDDNIIHSLLYPTISSYLDQDFSILTWGQLNRDNSIRLRPTQRIEPLRIDTASYLIKWKYNKHVRHQTHIYEHDGVYAEECAQNGPVIFLNTYLCYYNYLRPSE